MAGIPTISRSSTVATIRNQYLFTWCRLSTHKLTRALADEFVAAVKDDLDAVVSEEEQLTIRSMLAAANAVFTDNELDEIVDQLSALFAGNRNDPVYRFCFGPQRPSEIKRPVLNRQLETMTKWLPVLEDAPSPAVRELGAKLKELLPRAQAAADEKEAAHDQFKQFRNVSSRMQLVDTLNAARVEVHGKLAKLQHETPHLPNNWARQFFVSDSTGEVSLRSLELSITALEIQLEEQRTQRNRLLQEEAWNEERRQKAARALDRAELLANEKAMQELLARQAELQAKLEPEPPP